MNIRCTYKIMPDMECPVPLKYSFMTTSWVHTINDGNTTHEAIPPEGTPIPKTLIEEIMDENVGKLQKAQAKYGPLVSKLTDMDFAGLYRVVMEERDKRMGILIATNPFVRQLAIDDLRKKYGEGK